MRGLLVRGGMGGMGGGEGWEGGLDWWVKVVELGLGVGGWGLRRGERNRVDGGHKGFHAPVGNIPTPNSLSILILE